MQNCWLAALLKMFSIIFSYGFWYISVVATKDCGSVFSLCPQITWQTNKALILLKVVALAFNRIYMQTQLQLIHFIRVRFHWLSCAVPLFGPDLNRSLLSCWKRLHCQDGCCDQSLRKILSLEQFGPVFTSNFTRDALHCLL